MNSGIDRALPVTLSGLFNLSVLQLPDLWNKTLSACVIGLPLEFKELFMEVWGACLAHSILL
jgi:hypothetical protein